MCEGDGGLGKTLRDCVFERGVQEEGVWHDGEAFTGPPKICVSIRVAARAYACVDTRSVWSALPTWSRHACKCPPHFCRRGAVQRGGVCGAHAVGRQRTLRARR